MSDASSQTGSVPSPVDFVALPAGRTIGRYEVVSVPGQGGFGIPYRARDSQLGREVAIKEYLPAALAVRQDGRTVLPRSTNAAEDFTWGRERFVAEVAAATPRSGPDGTWRGTIHCTPSRGGGDST